ncbi:hypothetical protein D3C75_1094040 [compost metagenome]
MTVKFSSVTPPDKVPSTPDSAIDAPGSSTAIPPTSAITSTIGQANTPALAPIFSVGLPVILVTS